MKITERYATAINATNLASAPNTTYSQSDVIAAHGFAARRFPLGVALQRFFVDGKARECIQLMADMARDRSHKVRTRLTPVQSTKVAQKVLAWYRHGVCDECGGVGKQIIIEPRPHLSDVDCQSCNGSGKRPFNKSFNSDTLEVAEWLRNEVQKHQSIASKAATYAIGNEGDS